MNIYMLQAIYEPQDTDRNAEIKYCFDYNARNSLVHTYLHMAGRPTFNTAFSIMRDRSNMTSERNCYILMNSDIFIPINTIKMLNNFMASCMAPLDKVCLALSRWDLMADGELLHYDHLDSQDTWIFFSPVPHIEGANFYVGGVPGCDNKIAYLLEQAGYKIFNPSKDLQTIHYHLKESHRTYTDAERIVAPYKLVPTCKLDQIVL